MMKKARAVLIGALDTKGTEYAFVRDIVKRAGIETLIIDTSVLDEPLFQPDISSAQVAAAAGTSIQLLRELQDRGKAVAAMTAGAAAIISQLVQEREVGAIFAMGGTAGTTVGASAMQAAPIGIPKLLVSTVASGNTSPYVGVKDVMMMYSVIDISGINSLSSRILSNAAYALIGMCSGLASEQTQDVSEAELAAMKPMLGMTMFGVTTPCCTRVREKLEAQGYEILVFHATGTGGKAMEELVRAGYIQGLLDITTTELADDLVGGIFSAGPNRMAAASEMGIPQIVSVGAMDMVNYGPPDSVPAVHAGRLFYPHNPTTTLMRTTVEENAQLGRRLAAKLSTCSPSQAVLVFPRGGVSLLDSPGNAFHGDIERQALLEGIKSELQPHIPLVESEHAVNDTEFADLIVNEFLLLMTNWEAMR
jgi:uncharacterized protein (UPF0261 family)